MAKRPNYLKAALLMPANLFAVLAGGLASLLIGDWTPLLAAGGASVVYLTLLSTMPTFRRAVRANFNAQEFSDVASPRELEALLADLSASQREHYQVLRDLRDRILERYRSLPGGRVLAASSERRFDGLLTSFLRLVMTLNSYRRFLGTADRTAIERELAQLEEDLRSDSSERLREVKRRRVELLQKRLQRFRQAEESREVVSHQLATIEDVLLLTHEQSIALRDPEAVGRHLEALTAEVAATEDTVKEMEQFMEISEVPSVPARVEPPVRVR